MAKMELRVSFAGAPGQILKQLFGEAKNAKIILQAVEFFQGHAHEQEIFHFVNTDSDGDWVLETNSKGESVVVVSMQNLRKQLATMVLTGQLKRLGERSARYAAMDFEGTIDEGEDDENGEATEGETEEAAE